MEILLVRSHACTQIEAMDRLASSQRCWDATTHDTLTTMEYVYPSQSIMPGWELTLKPLPPIMRVQAIYHRSMYQYFCIYIHYSKVSCSTRGYNPATGSVQNYIVQAYFGVQFRQSFWPTNYVLSIYKNIMSSSHSNKAFMYN